METTSVSEYRDHLRMIEILNCRMNYESLLYENYIFVNKNIRHLSRKTVDNIRRYFSKKHPYYPGISEQILSICNYYNELLECESLDIS